MSASWAQAITEIAAAAGGLAVWFRKQGTHQGKTDQLLAQLVADTTDLKQAVSQLTTIVTSLQDRTAALEAAGK